MPKSSGHVEQSLPSPGSAVPDLEDDLRILRGTLKALTMISVCQDEIHPEGLHVLARFGEEALDRVYAAWEAARSGQGVLDHSAD
ncbi:MAG: hypothetical protein M9955_22430 [Rhizobiaceae bacterium]|nr:hypothetical protein [Rhizobiaceae bacterium]